MKKEQVIGFLKAPFSKSFITSYCFNFFVLLSVPLLSCLMTLLFENMEKIGALPEEELGGFLVGLLRRNIRIGEVWAAGTGIVLAFVLLSSYALLLTHKTAMSKKGVFNAECFSFSLGEILATVPKFLGFVLLGGLTSFLFMGLLSFVATFAIVFGMVLSKVLGILLIIVCGGASIYLVYRWICYLLTFNFIFHRDFLLSDFFRYRKIQTFFKAHKKKIFIAWLLCFVVGQMAYTLYGAIGVSIFEKILVAGGIMGAFHLSNVVPIALGILIWGFFVTYIMLLQAIVLGKVILWITKK